MYDELESWKQSNFLIVQGINMSLNDYNSASQLITAMNDNPQFVRVIAGEREGTVGRVEEVRAKYYSVYDYKILVKDRRSFWINGSNLEHLEGFEGNTCWIVNRETPVYNDLTGRRIELGHTLLFPRAMEGGRIETVIGTVQKISPKGTIYAKIFMNSQMNQAYNQTVRVGKPSSTVILDNNTINQVMLAKLSC